MPLPGRRPTGVSATARSYQGPPRDGHIFRAQGAWATGGQPGPVVVCEPPPPPPAPAGVLKDSGRGGVTGRTIVRLTRFFSEYLRHSQTMDSDPLSRRLYCTLPQSPRPRGPLSPAPPARAELRCTARRCDEQQRPSACHSPSSPPSQRAHIRGIRGLPSMGPAWGGRYVPSTGQLFVDLRAPVINGG